MTVRELAKAAREIADYIDWERESLEDFHNYARRFSFQAGSNVYEHVLLDALRYRGLTLEQFRSEVGKF